MGDVLGWLLFVAFAGALAVALVVGLGLPLWGCVEVVRDWWRGRRR